MAYNRKEFVKDMKKAYPNVPELELHFGYLYYANALSQFGLGGLTIGLIPNLKKEIEEMGSIFDSSAGRMCVGDGWKIHYNDSFIMGGIHGHCDFTLVGANKWIEPGGKGDPNRQLVSNKDASKNVINGHSTALQLDYVSENMIPVSYGCLKVTQREIAALNLFGYSIQEDKANGNRVYNCTNVGKADAATMEEYVEHVSALQKAIAAS